MRRGLYVERYRQSMIPFSDCFTKRYSIIPDFFTTALLKDAKRLR